MVAQDFGLYWITCTYTISDMLCCRSLHIFRPAIMLSIINFDSAPAEIHVPLYIAIGSSKFQLDATQIVRYMPKETPKRGSLSLFTCRKLEILCVHRFKLHGNMLQYD